MASAECFERRGEFPRSEVARQFVAVQAGGHETGGDAGVAGSSNVVAQRVADHQNAPAGDTGKPLQTGPVHARMGLSDGFHPAAELTIALGERARSENQHAFRMGCQKVDVRADRRELPPRRPFEEGQIVLELPFRTVDPADEHEIRLVDILHELEIEPLDDLEIAGTGEQEAAATELRKGRFGALLQQLPGHLPRRHHILEERGIEAEFGETPDAAPASATGIGEDEATLARPAQPLDHRDHPLEWRNAIVHHPPLIEQEGIEAVCDFGKAADDPCRCHVAGLRSPLPWPRHEAPLGTASSD